MIPIANVLSIVSLMLMLLVANRLKHPTIDQRLVKKAFELSHLDTLDKNAMSELQSMKDNHQFSSLFLSKDRPSSQKLPKPPNDLFSRIENPMSYQGTDEYRLRGPDASTKDHSDTLLDEAALPTFQRGDWVRLPSSTPQAIWRTDSWVRCQRNTTLPKVPVSLRFCCCC